MNPAEGLDIETGLQAINNLLAWDRDKGDGIWRISPELMISDECQNLLAVCRNIRLVI